MIKAPTKLIAIIAITISPLISSAQVAPGEGDVVISEISGFKVTQDYLELYNTTSNSITLSNCKLIRTVSSGGFTVFDFSSEGSGDIIIPANDFLLISRGTTKSAFNSYWSIDVDAIGAKYNTGSLYALYTKSNYKLKYSGTPDTDDGTLIDQTISFQSTNVRKFQCPIGYFNNVASTLQSDYTPGSFDIYDDLATWDIKYTSSNTWFPATPSSSDGSKNALIVGTSTTINNGAILNDLYITEGASISNSTQNVTINGDLTIRDGGAFSISSNTGNLTVSGTSSIEVSGSNSINNFNVWSSPFTNTSIESTFTGTNPCDIYVFQASKQQWKYDYAIPYSTTCNGSAVTFTSANVLSSPEGTPDGNFDVGRGYFAPGSVSSIRTVTSSGTVNNGTITFPAYGTSLAIAGGNDWNLVGNPYISGLKVGKMILGNSMVNAVYLYNGATGAYTTHSSASTFILSPGQGFFIDINTATDGLVRNFVMSNTLRASTYNLFQKTNGNGIDTTIAYISIENNANLQDQIQIFIAPDCQDGYDSKFDARKLMNDHNLNFATLIESDPTWGPEPYVFNGVKSLEDQESKVIDLFVQTDSPGDFEIKLDSLRDMPLGMSIVLEDKETSRMTDLRADKYNFSSSLGDTLANRFYLHLSYDASITSIKDANINNKQINIYVQNEEINVKVLSNNFEISNIEVYDVLGKRIVTENKKGNSANVPTANFQSGIYIVKVTDNSGNIYTERVFVK